MRYLIPMAAMLACAAPALAQPENPQIDFAGFVALAGQVEQERAQRLLPFGAFMERAQSNDALLLDARSAADFAAGHIEGAVNLPLPEFTAQRLAQVIGADRNRPILIYCNNNFINDVPPVTRKAIELALNIQTFINLTGYGYPNVFELGDVMDLSDPDVRWTGANAAALPYAPTEPGA
ncbi:rhodanese-like domain-containing protein [uncultured Parasphingopyxis sp.]|uniref:rhodanese-like domain-containing protein n=1 Tax=uncultured Parasphingopyxis sp. TaxID=1547918 RepID=UPI0026246FFD|nr:rhodanese-like domain-containing protein [uncultured Parasphingopyxis sp.]